MKLPKVHFPKIKKKLFWWVMVGLMVVAPIVSLVRAEYNVNVNPFENYRQAMNASLMNSSQWTANLLIKEIPLAGNRVLWGFPTLQGETQTSGGVARAIAYLIDSTYQAPPLSSNEYLADIGNRLQIVRPAYAQGSGWDFLRPVISIWKTVRNVVYICFVVVFIFIGFAIMLRQKIDPQVTANIQNAIPKIVVALILVTFSYAICGLIVDLAYLGNKVVGAGMKDAVRFGLISDWNEKLDIMSFLMGNEGQRAAALLNPVGTNIQPGQTPNQISAAIAAFDLIKKFMEGLANVFVKGDFAPLFLFIIALVIISNIFKIFFALLTRYVSLILYAIFSPIVALTMAFPGNAGEGGRFFKSYLSHALTFPVVLLLLNLASFFLLIPPFNPANPDRSPLAGPFRSDLYPFAIPGGGNPNDFQTTIKGFVAMGILLFAARVPDLLDELFKTKPIGAGIGAEPEGMMRKIPIIGSFLG